MINIRNLDELNSEYQAKAKREGFSDLGDASEALAATCDLQLKGWLGDFILRYETTEALQDGKFGPEGSEAEKMARALIAILGTPGNVHIYAARSIARDTLKSVQS